MGGLDDADDKKRGYFSAWLGVFGTGLLGMLDKCLTIKHNFTIK